jgi:hypothetical protein
MSAIFTVVRSEIFSLEPISQVPCRNCQFFSSNPYLPCAVHPGMALTENAVIALITVLKNASCSTNLNSPVIAKGTGAHTSR